MANGLATNGTVSTMARLKGVILQDGSFVALN
jgi:hypothetical protein